MVPQPLQRLLRGHLEPAQRGQVLVRRLVAQLDEAAGHVQLGGHVVHGHLLEAVLHRVAEACDEPGQAASALCGLRGLIRSGNMSFCRVTSGGDGRKEIRSKRVPVEGGAVGIANGQERGGPRIVVERSIDELGGRVKSMRQRRSSLPRGDLFWG